MAFALDTFETAFGKDPRLEHMNSFVKWREDSGGIHTNIGFPDMAFYKAAMSLGTEATANIWAFAISFVKGPRPTFAEFSEAMIMHANAVNEDSHQKGLAARTSVGVDVIKGLMVVPKYPGPLPGGIRPTVKEVALRKLSTDQAKVFMDIEYPQGGPVSFAATSRECHRSPIETPPWSRHV